MATDKSSPTLSKTRTALLLAALLAWCGGATAAAVFSTTLDLPGSSQDDSDQQPFSSALADGGSFFGNVEASAAAAASLIKLGARASFAIPAQEFAEVGIVTGAAGSSAGLRYDDVVFTHVSDPSNTTPISVSTNFVLDGFFALENGSDDTRASAGISVNYGLGTGLANAVTTIGGITRTRDNGTLTASNSGVFQDHELNDDMSIHGVFASSVLTVPVGVPVPLSLRIIAGSEGASRDGAAVAGAANFLDTLFLASDGPVFNLPEGYTAHSPSARIVDNHVQPVPLPASLFMLGAAVLALLPGRRLTRVS